MLLAAAAAVAAAVAAAMMMMTTTEAFQMFCCKQFAITITNNKPVICTTQPFATACW
jgi:hypothetical protein